MKFWYLLSVISPFCNAFFIPQFSSLICLHPIYSQSFIYCLNSLKYSANLSDSISEISKVEKPGVSAIYSFSLILYNAIFVVVFLPFLFLSLISPALVNSFPKMLFNKVDFPTPEFPANTLILFSKSLFRLSTPSFSFAFVSTIG